MPSSTSESSDSGLKMAKRKETDPKETGSKKASKTTENQPEAPKPEPDRDLHRTEIEFLQRNYDWPQNKKKGVKWKSLPPHFAKALEKYHSTFGEAAEQTAKKDIARQAAEHLKLQGAKGPVIFGIILIVVLVFVAAGTAFGLAAQGDQCLASLTNETTTHNNATASNTSLSSESSDVDCSSFVLRTNTAIGVAAGLSTAAQNFVIAVIAAMVNSPYYIEVLWKKEADGVRAELWITSILALLVLVFNVGTILATVVSHHTDKFVTIVLSTAFGSPLFALATARTILWAVAPGTIDDKVLQPTEAAKPAV